ncbi:unnamed protein product [Fraxinus pennsylvanica]|uniref:RNase H type-1 domain-containing protein n=1 Tax=Fraxinus pennsylvanica TaxID=56036 RepID=A0AAD2ECZ5_9LAMI|nr:unnamed protein product [Fraxinus pennsylvanica]
MVAESEWEMAPRLESGKTFGFLTPTKVLSLQNHAQGVKMPLRSTYYSRKGAYSVRSGYNLLMEDSFLHSHTSMESFWNNLWRCIVDPLIAETLGVREALSWIKSNFSGVQTIEMDALLVYSALQNDGVDNSYLGILIEECRLIAREMSNLKFNWVRKSANKVAHTLAKAASSLHDIVDWSYFPPSFISNVADLMNE